MQIDTPTNCTQQCNQGRACTCAPEPAQACTDIGADDLPLRCRPIWSVVAALGGWAVLIVAWAIYTRYF